jgi:hypothetical protein
VRRRAGLHGLLAAFALLAFACSPELDWRELRSEDGRFVALLPGKPRLEERELSGRQGAVMHLWSARAGEAVYGVGYLDDKAPADSTLVERTRDALVANVRGRVVEDKEITVGAARGREFRAEGPDTVLAARVLVAGRRQYQVAVIGKKGSVDTADVEMFFSSFRPAPEPPAK